MNKYERFIIKYFNYIKPYGFGVWLVSLTFGPLGIIVGESMFALGLEPNLCLLVRGIFHLIQWMAILLLFLNIAINYSIMERIKKYSSWVSFNYHMNFINETIGEEIGGRVKTVDEGEILDFEMKVRTVHEAYRNCKNFIDSWKIFPETGKLKKEFYTMFNKFKELNG